MDKSKNGVPETPFFNFEFAALIWHVAITNSHTLWRFYYENTPVKLSQGELAWSFGIISSETGYKLGATQKNY